MRAMMFANAVAAGLMCLPALAQDEVPIPVTLKELLANHATYNGKLVRVRGQIDNCIGFTCNLCEQEMTRESRSGTCVGLTLSGFADKQDSSYDRVSGFMADAFRFASVTLDARVDDLCYRDDVTCTDSIGLLSDARVQVVHARKTAKDGLFDPFYDYGSLTPPTAEDSNAMIAELQSHIPEDYAANELAVFRIPDDGDMKDYGLGCVCRLEAGGCAEKWPDRYFGGFDSPANPFECYELQKRGGIWRLLVSLY